MRACGSGKRFGSFPVRYVIVGVLALAGGILTIDSATALGRSTDTPTAANDGVRWTQNGDATEGAAPQVPMPDAGRGKAKDSAPDGALPDDASPEDALPDDTPADDDPSKEESVTKQAPALPVMYDVSKLPQPVRRMRELIVEAAKSGDLQKLRPLLGSGPTETQLAISGNDSDPIEYLRSVSGDDEGQEVLAILLDILDAGFVEMDPGTPNATYVWPYFFTTPLDQLTAKQRVELFRIVTAGDYKDMKTFGGYNFYRVGISPDGEWKFFVAGD